jgi:class 3 adenylate cyclase
MQCGACGQQNREGARFCLGCGGRLAAGCARCGAELPAAARFCDECGAEVPAAAGEAAPAASAARSRPRELRSYTPQHLADRILQSRSALEGERKEVTVLFADVQGSLELAEGLDPEEWHGILDRFFQILADGVHRFEGTVNQFTGDGIMALFGAPIAHEDHARRACYAALHLGEELRRYANELRLRRGLNFSVRMGLNSGPVVVGKIGDDLRMDYTAQGHTVGLAARMQQIAEPGKVYLTDHCAALVEGYFQLGDLGALEIRGAHEPLRVHELQGIGRLRTRLDASHARGLSRFVGRGEEMQALEAALARAREGNTQVIGVVGEAGLGKSRLCYEFLERCRGRGLMTYEAHGVAHGKAIPFLPILQLFRAFFGITEQDSASTARERIAGRLLLLGDRFRDALPIVFEFLGVADPENPAPRMDPEARQRQMFDMVRGVIEARGTRETTITLLEDLHWFDGGSEAFLEPLTDARPGSRGLLIVNFRPEYRSDWMCKSFYLQLPLVPLGPEAVRELLDDLIGRDPSTEGLAEAIHARTAGNPFFTEEVVQSLIESGKLAGQRGSYRLLAPVDKLEVPSSVQAILAARIDRLPEREKHVLGIAAVIGRQFSEPILAEVAELPAAQLAEALAHLKGAEFVYDHALYPVAEYTFKHPLTQEVALASQLQERRRRIHAAVARAIEAACAEEGDEGEQAALLAHHWDEAGDAARAALWHRRAAEWASSSDMAEAARHWQRVRKLASEFPEQVAAEHGARACEQILTTGWRLGLSEQEEAAVFAEGQRFAERTASAEAAIRLEVSYVTLRCLAGDPQGGVEHALVGERLAEGEQHAELRVTATCSAVYPLTVLGRLEESRARLDAALEALSLHPHWGSDLIGVDLYAWGDGYRASDETWRGSLDAATRIFEHSIPLAREQKSQEAEGWNLGMGSDAAWMQGDAEAALTRAQQALEIAERIGSPFSRVLAQGFLGKAMILGGHAEEAIALLEDTLRTARERRIGLETEARLLASLAQALLAAGELDRARAIAEEGVAAGQRIGTPLYEVEAQLALARVLLRQRGGDAAPAVRSALERTEALLRETGAKNFQAFVHLERAELARLGGDPASWRRELATAERLFREMGATRRAEALAASLA